MSITKYEAYRQIRIARATRKQAEKAEIRAAAKLAKKQGTKKCRTIKVVKPNGFDIDDLFD
jgi:hypothetical protein